MTDIVDRQTRSRMMSEIRWKNTMSELVLRHSFLALGLRYRLHAKDVPGKPDIVMPKCHAVIFVHGCFWHRAQSSGPPNSMQMPGEMRQFSPPRWKRAGESEQCGNASCGPRPALRKHGT
jgi:DNA mismatch endonuclease Vsr